MSTIGQPLTAPESGWKRYDDTHPALKYEGEYTKGTNASIYNQTYTSLKHNDKVKFKFEGKMVRLITWKSASRSTNISVKIDGVEEAFSDYSSSTTDFQILSYEKILEYGTHYVEIVNKGEESGGLVLDAIDIDGDGRLLHPDEVLDPKDLEVGKRIRCHYKATSNAVGVFSSLGKEVYKDGITDFILPASSATPNGSFYFIMVEDHNGEKRLVADRNIQHSISWDTLNSVGIASGSGLPFEHNLQTPLVAWYKMNEGSGTTLFDSAGHSNGTIVATAWEDDENGEKVLNLDGIDDYVQLNSKLPLKKVSVRIRFKIQEYNDTSLTLLSTADWNESKKGVDFIIRQQTDPADGGKVMIIIRNLSNSFTITSSEKVLLNQWNDLYFTWTGDKSENGIKLYLNDMLTPSFIGTSTVEIDSYSDNIVLGKFSTRNQNYFKGQLSNLEIYNDVIDPLTTQPTQDKYQYNVRLLTGGVSASDKDNEWDKYIVNSTLNDTITAGSNNVWNWNIDGKHLSITSTRPTSATGRGSFASEYVRRGYSTVGAWYGDSTTYYTATTTGFRPVLEMVTLIKDYMIISSNGQGYKHDGSSWQNVGLIPLTKTERDDFYLTNGMDKITKEQLATLSSAVPTGKITIARV